METTTNTNTARLLAEVAIRISRYVGGAESWTTDRIIGLAEWLVETVAEDRLDALEIGPVIRAWERDGFSR